MFWHFFHCYKVLNDIPPSQACTFFTETQVEIAKRVEKIITSDLRQHHPAWELAAQFSVSETSLKKLFSWRFWSKHIYLSSGNANEKSC